MPRTILSLSSIPAVFSGQRFFVLVILVRELEFRLPFGKPRLSSRRVQLVPYTATRNCVKRNGSTHGERFKAGTGFRLRFVSCEEIDEGDRETRRKEVIDLVAEAEAERHGVTICLEAPDAFCRCGTCIIPSAWTKRSRTRGISSARGWRTCI